ncbi:retrovirus-related Pol polyprotein from transposon TNT 1-94 [Gossypium australe]|uniref:Retrovirus-related Pol polyprotein from transposon TNT 1-94 n=1 Tax=Gossypium australe TaxID=47621 RepID=A0A5B6VIA4_9ROSI|nr:retrovirus-related Pol polyprotein from transposon TNT 1-94 [Gossypium australe]
MFVPTNLPLPLYRFTSYFSSYAEAISDPIWVDAMQQEIQALEDNGTWEVIFLPAGAVPIGYKWVYKIKYNSDGSVERFKAEVGEHKMCRMLKSLYGLKQAYRQWNLKLTEALMQGGYIQRKYDYSLFSKRQGGNIVILLVYVDDLLIIRSDIGMINELKKVMHQNFKMKDLGALKYFFGIEVMRSNEGIVLNQRKYALELIADEGLGEAKPATTPLEQNQKLTSIEYDESVQMRVDGDELIIDVAVYQRLLGSEK